MDRKTKLKKINIQRKYLLFLICITTLFMSVGYASINSVSFDINGTAQANKQEGIFITDYKYVSDINADLENSKIESIYQSNLKSTIALSNIDPNSSITYEITIYNSTDDIYAFDKVNYIIGENTYSNTDITFTLNNLTEETVINSKSRNTFTITFHYKNGVISQNNILNSYLNFNFTKKYYDYSYIGKYETFTAPTSGTYKIELWGAQGGRGSADTENYIYEGGRGAYTSGNIYLQENTLLYIYVGESGLDHSYNNEKLTLKAFNGGGAGGFDISTDETSDAAGSGGGATDIRYNGTSLNDRIMVAAGGGGGVWNSKTTYEGQNAGGLLVKGLSIRGYHEDITVLDGTQTSGYAFGYGEDGYSAIFSAAKGGGGGGYWSGKVEGDNTQGAGGVSYISGHTGCVAISSNSSITARKGTNNNSCITGTTDNLCSIHYSNYYFTDTIMVDGNGYSWTNQKGTYTKMPTYDGKSTMIGNANYGYAKITFLKSSN